MWVLFVLWVTNADVGDFKANLMTYKFEEKDTCARAQKSYLDVGNDSKIMAQCFFIKK